MNANWAERLMKDYFDSKTKKIKNENKKEKILNCNSLEELLEVEYGKKGTAQRDKFDKETENQIRREKQNGD